jgi:DMSO reductase family type II enzyme heme b subunit
MGFVVNTAAIVFSSFLLFSPSQVFADSQDHLPGIKSKTVEELIEMTNPKGEGAREKANLLQKGKTTYRQFCVHCHGERGQGKGETSLYLYPHPRDVTLGIFKFRSTSGNALPRDEDLYQTIQNGVPGTAMPAWGDVLNDQSLRALVEYIKTFSDRFQQESPDHVMPIGLEPVFDELSINRGKVLYRELRCGRCHGEEGEREGSLEQELNDAWGNPSKVYDLRRTDLYKGGASSDEVYQILVTGMDGTPMSAYDYVSGDELWHLVHFLQSRYKHKDLDSTKMSETIYSLRVSENLEVSPLAGIWKKAPKTRVKLRALQSINSRISGLYVQSLHNDNKISFRLQWPDDSPDRAEPGASSFLDGVALQFVSDSNIQSTYYGMGERNKPVNIWHWRADSSQKVVGREAVSNSIKLDPFREQAVEELNASGFGTLTVQSLEDQQVRGKGVWQDGQWTVVFVRELDTGSPYDAHFSEAGKALMAVALWDGTLKEKNANKRVSFWQKLKFQ